MSRAFFRLAAIAIAVLGSACVASRTDAGPRSDRNVITKEQLTKNHYATIYDAVEGLRSKWLQTRGADSFQSPTQVKVYLDNSLFGGIESMRNIVTTTISYVRWFDGVSATSRWGLDHGAGVIYVSTRPATSNNP